ncbi:MAG: glycosyltransferase [Planctomycetes bacterium]|nr:glycosyltransferase [Planctomycetota bacterium]
MKIALVHHWLVSRRGGERCLEAMLRVAPGSDVFTLVHDPRAWPVPDTAGRIVTSGLQRWPGGVRFFRALLPLLPRFYGALDLSGHDLVLSSDAALAKTVRVPEGVPHVCYCYSPIRYAWDLRETYLEQAVPRPLRPLARRMLDGVQRSDLAAARRVDLFVAISRHVAERIRRCYGRDAEVIHPPVDTVFYTPGAPDDGLDARAETPADGESREAAAASDLLRDLAAREPSERPYLMVGEVVPYKRFVDGVVACAALDRALIVAGGGSGFARLRRLAGPRTRFVMRPDDVTLRALYRGARALLYPGEEDFGIVPVEALACGCPVIAYGVGGAAETVRDGRDGVLYAEPGAPALGRAIHRFESMDAGIERSHLHSRACTFSAEVHERSMVALIERVRV